MTETKSVIATSTLCTSRIDDLELVAGVATPIPDDPALIARLKQLRGVVIQDIVTETIESSRTTTLEEN